MTSRRSVLAALVLTGAFWAGCTSPPAGPGAREREVLAPAGKLRVGVYPGSPTSLVKTASREARGVSVEIGRQFAQRLGVPYEQVEFERLAAVLDALKAGEVDFTITNATPARAADMNFSAALVELELGYLVMPGARVRTIADVDQPGIKVGVSQGSSSQAALTRQFTHAQVVPATSLKVAAAMLSQAQIDTFATNKAILFEMADGLPGAKVLDGRWGVEQLAIAIPKGREDGMAFVRRFAEDVKADGSVQRAAERADLRGTVMFR